MKRKKLLEQSLLNIHEAIEEIEQNLDSLSQGVKFYNPHNRYKVTLSYEGVTVATTVGEMVMDRAFEDLKDELATLKEAATKIECYISSRF